MQWKPPARILASRGRISTLGAHLFAGVSDVGVVPLLRVEVEAHLFELVLGLWKRQFIRNDHFVVLPVYAT